MAGRVFQDAAVPQIAQIPSVRGRREAPLTEERALKNESTVGSEGLIFQGSLFGLGAGLRPAPRTLLLCVAAGAGRQSRN